MDEILASIRRILAEDDHAMTRPSPRSRANGDVLDLTEAINDDGSLRHIPPIALVTPEAAAQGCTMAGSNRPRRAPRSIGKKGGGPSAGVGCCFRCGEKAASFARLASVPRREDGDRSLDDIVRETLRPMLQAWLDEHLPELVERLVRAEIARVVGAIRPSAP